LICVICEICGYFCTAMATLLEAALARVTATETAEPDGAASGTRALTWYKPT
jgi:hypothetical protein